MNSKNFVYNFFSSRTVFFRSSFLWCLKWYNLIVLLCMYFQSSFFLFYFRLALFHFGIGFSCSDSFLTQTMQIFHINYIVAIFMGFLLHFTFSFMKEIVKRRWNGIKDLHLHLKMCMGVESLIISRKRKCLLIFCCWLMNLYRYFAFHFEWPNHSPDHLILRDINLRCWFNNLKSRYRRQKKQVLSFFSAFFFQR